MRIFKRTRSASAGSVADARHTARSSALGTANAIITASGRLMACTR